MFGGLDRVRHRAIAKGEAMVFPRALPPPPMEPTWFECQGCETAWVEVVREDRALVWRRCPACQGHGLGAVPRGAHR